MLVLPKQHLDRLPVASLTRPALCWSIQPAVNFVEALRFTDHCRELTLEDGFKYSPVGGLEGTAVSRPAGFGPSDREVRGVIDSVRVTDAMIRGGWFRDAIVTETLVDWLMPWVAPIHKVRYIIEELTEVEPSVWEAKLGGLRSILQTQVGGYYSPRCQVEVFSLGPGKCNADIRSHQVSITGFGFSLFADGARFYDFGFSASVSFADDIEHWKDGRIDWIEGNNIGWTSYCRAITHIGPPSMGMSSYHLELHEPVPNPVLVDDTLILTRGCNHVSGIFNIEGDCKHFYNNLLNFQGEPFLPGRERTIKGLETTG